MISAGYLLVRSQARHSSKGSGCTKRAASATTCRQITISTNIYNGSVHQGRGPRSGSQGATVPHGGRKIRHAHTLADEAGGRLPVDPMTGKGCRHPYEDRKPHLPTDGDYRVPQEWRSSGNTACCLKGCRLVLVDAIRHPNVDGRLSVSR